MNDLMPLSDWKTKDETFDSCNCNIQSKYGRNRLFTLSTLCQPQLQSILCLHFHLCVVAWIHLSHLSLLLSVCLWLSVMLADKNHQSSQKKVTCVCVRGNHFNTVHIAYNASIISVHKSHLYLTFFIKRLMWFSFSSRVFFKASTSLWLSTSSLCRRWLVSSRVSQKACSHNQQITNYSFDIWPLVLYFCEESDLTLLSSRLSNGLSGSAKHRKCLTASLRRKQIQKFKSN